MTSIKDQRAAVIKLREPWKHPPRLPIEKWQRTYPKDAPIKGPVRIIKATLDAPPETEIRDAVYSTYEALRTGEQYILPPEKIPIQKVDVEWIGPRKTPAEKSEDFLKTDKERYDHLRRECGNDGVIVFVHGGAFYLGSAVASRSASTRLAVEANMSVVSISYRLAPQDPFPSALIDLFTAYMSLLYPDENELSWHDSTPPKLVLTGDSAGANLCLALVQVLLHLKRSGCTYIRFRGRDRTLLLPFGLAFQGPWCDLTDSFPSFERNANLDYLPYPQPPLTPCFPADGVWPTSPPRGHMYCDATALDHPLISPCAALDWSGTPPIYMALGMEERGIDPARTLAAQARKQGVSIHWEEYEGMPHCFALMLSKLPQAVYHYKSWGAACTMFASTSSDSSSSPMPSSMRRIKMPDCQVVNIEEEWPGHTFLDWASGSEEEMRRKMKQSAAIKFPAWRGKIDSKASI